MPLTKLSALDLLARLIAFDTTSRESNLALIDFIRDYLDGWGIASELYFDSDRRKANLFATIGPHDRGGLMLSGHTDTVPVDGQAWDSDPFTVTLRDRRLYARGSADMKGFIAVALSRVPDFAAARIRMPLHLAFSYDEEVGCTGVRDLIADVSSRSVRPLGCVVGEPTLMTPVTAHKAKLTMRCEVHGHEAHSALTHQGVNAVETAAEIVARLRNMARHKRVHGPYDEGFTPPYTTIQVGTIRGGTAVNIVPRHCFFDFEIRAIPADDAPALVRQLRDYALTTLLPEMQAVSATSAIHFHEVNNTPGLSVTAEDPLVKLVQTLSGANDTGKVSYTAEAGLFQAAAIPAILCGPGSIEQAHKPNEFVSVDEIARCETFVQRLFEHLLA
jgi:acetylornithine deacetylase